MPKNVQTTIHLCLFHMQLRLCLKFFKLGFSSTRTEDFQMYKLGLEKSEEKEEKSEEKEESQIKLPTFVGS